MSANGSGCDWSIPTLTGYIDFKKVIRPDMDKKSHMKKEIGLWIDHRKAVIVIITDEGEEIKKITSNMEKHVRFTGGTASEDGSTEECARPTFGNHLNSYYDQVIAVLRDATRSRSLAPARQKAS